MVIDLLKKFGTKNLARQAAKLVADYPESSYAIGRLEGGQTLLVWEGLVQSREHGRKYRLCLNYAMGDKPHIWIVEPALHKDKTEYPHTYSGNRLCLYLPKERSWHKSLWISETILPWACLWLYFYEIHQITGEWMGGGKHPNEVEAEPPPRAFDKFRTKKKPKKLFSAIKCIRLNELEKS